MGGVDSTLKDIATAPIDAIKNTGEAVVKTTKAVAAAPTKVESALSQAVSKASDLTDVSKLTNTVLAQSSNLVDNGFNSINKITDLTQSTLKDVSSTYNMALATSGKALTDVTSGFQSSLNAVSQSANKLVDSSTQLSSNFVNAQLQSQQMLLGSVNNLSSSVGQSITSVGDGLKGLGEGVGAGINNLSNSLMLPIIAVGGILVFMQMNQRSEKA